MASSTAEIAINAIQTSEFSALDAALANQQLPESFGILTDPELSSLMADQIGSSDIASWITDHVTWDTALYDPHLTLNPASYLLHLLWQDLSARLSRKLESVSQRTLLAPKGAILCFFGRADLSIVVEFRRAGGGAARLRPLAALLQPNGVLELPNLLIGTSPDVRNAIKNTAFTVDKLVYQRGCIVHVNRQHEDVFGPTIDTVLLGELIAELLDSRNLQDSLRAIEIGPGSGLLSTLLASSPRVNELSCVDLNSAAVACTLKNLHINDVTLDAKHQTVRVRAERFDARQHPDSFDLMVCNPPYIPDEPRSSSPSSREYGRAVGGLGLCTDILSSLDTLLSPNGLLLLMVSSLSAREVNEAIPSGFQAISALDHPGRRVPLDVDAVWQNSSWQARLLAEQRIEQINDGSLWHQLMPLWISRKTV